MAALAGTGEEASEEASRIAVVSEEEEAGEILAIEEALVVEGVAMVGEVV